MTGGFDANVPARKPRTRIGRVLNELTSDTGSDEPEEVLEGDGIGDLFVVDESADAGEPTASAPPDAIDRAPSNGTPTKVATEAGEIGGDARDAAVPSTPAAAPVDSARLAAGRERVASLRERLASASRASVAGNEPKRTVATVVGVLEDLRARLETAIRERGEMARELDEARVTLARAESELQKERRVRGAIEAREQERIRIAEEALAEAEALAAERDQVLSELSEQRRLDDEQATLLAEAEAALENRDQERAAAAAQIADLREQLEARAVQIADLESRLQAGRSDQARLEARCRDLETEVAELAEARQALEAIEATLNPKP
jgi:hypothetical protein